MAVCWKARRLLSGEVEDLAGIRLGLINPKDGSSRGGCLVGSRLLVRIRDAVACVASSREARRNIVTCSLMLAQRDDISGSSSQSWWSFFIEKAHGISSWHGTHGHA